MSKQMGKTFTALLKGQVSGLNSAVFKDYI